MLDHAYYLLKRLQKPWFPFPPVLLLSSQPRTKRKTPPNFAKISLHSKLLLLSFSQINSAFSFQFSILHHFFFFFVFPSHARTKPDDEATNSAASRNYTSSFLLLSLLNTTAAAAITSTTTTTTRNLQRILQKVSSCSATHFSGFLLVPQILKTF
jgi:hypothetical protein